VQSKLIKLPDGPTIVIRDCEKKDLPRVQRIENASFDTPYTQDFFLNLLKSCVFRIAESTGTMVGYCIYKVEAPLSTVRFGSSSLLVSLAVEKSWRRKGVASALLKEVLQDLEQNKSRSIELQVAETNSSAIQLYAKFGFIRAGLIKDYYGTGKHALLMIKQQSIPN
jgi:[ribosomal protein S18]-alanine N-acetyltransferase